MIASTASNSCSASATPSTASTSAGSIALAAGVGDELLERPERVAEAAGGVARDQRQRARLDVDPLLAGDPLEHGRHLLDRRAAEVEAVAAVDDRRQHLLRLGRGQHEDRPRRRLLERLQERVPRLRGEHVRLVEDVDLVAPGDRGVGHLLAQVADVVDRVVRRRVHLDHVERGGVGDRHARVALAARGDGRALDAVQARGEDLRHARLAGAARADEQVGVVDLAPARRRCGACGRRAPDRRRRRRCGGGGGGRARGRSTREVESSDEPAMAPPAGARRADRAPSVEAGTRGAATVSRLRSGAPAAPEGGRLRLLPSGPDLVHGSSSPRDRTINAAHRALTSGPVPLGRGFSPARADCGYRAPLAPRLARSTRDRSASERASDGSSHLLMHRTPAIVPTEHDSGSRRARLRRVAAGGRVRRGRRRRHRARRRSAQGLSCRRRRLVHRGHLRPSGCARCCPKIRATYRYADLAQADAVIICVPTPLTDNREPDLGPLDAAGQVAGAGAPARPADRARVDHVSGHDPRAAAAPARVASGLRVGTDINLAFSPERVDPGRTDYTLRNTPKVIGGDDAGVPRSRRRALQPRVRSTWSASPRPRRRR